MARKVGVQGAVVGVWPAPGQATEPLLQDANRLDKEAVDSKQQIHLRAAILRVHQCKRATITPAEFTPLKSEGDIVA